MCRFVFSSLRHQGGFDSQDSLSFIHAANDIKEIVFVAMPKPGAPGKVDGSRGSGRQGERWGDRIYKEHTQFITICKYIEHLNNNKEIKKYLCMWQYLCGSMQTSFFPALTNIKPPGLGCAGITPRSLYTVPCPRFAPSSLLGHAQTLKYFSSRNELLSQGGNPVPDCPVLAFIAWVNPGWPGLCRPGFPPSNTPSNTSLTFTNKDQGSRRSIALP